MLHDWGGQESALSLHRTGTPGRSRAAYGIPRPPNGDVMVGKSLYGAALNNEGPLRLGRQASEWEGWRFLGMGLAQATGNVDRYRIQLR